MVAPLPRIRQDLPIPELLHTVCKRFEAIDDRQSRPNGIRYPLWGFIPPLETDVGYSF
ncbi:hypothetical protein [Nitrococcus mobilis]|uniref:hypothetical protein n=1 Tax=Nitrococcus mobilis TaxID=35797 RepID=UPI0002F4F0FB|nr:hypothetical protein [Nitrococcus mobilis]